VRLLHHAVHALAWGLLVVFALLWGVELSGLLTNTVRQRVANELGPLGERLQVERAALRWFEPALVLEGVNLVAEGAAEAPVLRLDRVVVSLDWSLRRLRALRVEGGRVLAGDRLLTDWSLLVRHRGSDRDEPPGGTLERLPGFVVSDLRLALELPDLSLFEVGSLDLLARPAGSQAFELAGRVKPTLSGAVEGPGRILVQGRLDEMGVGLTAWARDLAVATRALELPAPFGPLPVGEAGARVTLDSTFETGFLDGQPPRARLRASVAGGHVLPAGSDHPWEDVELEVDAEFQPRPAMDFWEREAWDARATLSATSASRPLHARLAFGRGVASGTWGEIWGTIEGLDLGEESLRDLGLPPTLAPQIEHLRATFAPEGTIDLAGLLQVQHGRSTSWDRDLAVHAAAHGELAITYHGWPEEPGTGLPYRVEGISGDALFAMRPRGSPPWRAAAVDLEGGHGPGRASGWLRMETPDLRSTRPVPSFELELEARGLALDEDVRAALEANRDLAWLWPTFAPQGGRFGTRWRLLSDSLYGGTTATGEVRLEGVGLRWSEVPVPLEGLSGNVSVRWAATPVPGPGPRGWVRPFGVSYHFDNLAAERVGAQAAVDGWVREDAPAEGWKAGEQPPLIQEIALDLPSLGLRGRDYDILVQSFPPLGRQLGELAARGRVRARYHGVEARVGAPFVSTIEATPIEVEVTPVFFQRRTPVHGRVLVDSVDDGSEQIVFASRHSLFGTWPGGVELATRGLVPPAGEATIQVFGAGIDPSNTSFKGALVTSLTAGATQNLDLSAWKLAGPVDFSMQATFDPSSEAEAEDRYRMYLRDNELETEDLALAHLNGTLNQAGDMLESEHVFGTLGGHPIELRNVRTFPLAVLRKVDDADPWLLREGFWTDVNGHALQADLYFRDLPLDEPHLASLLDEEALELVRDEHWTGQMDALGARLVVTSEGDDQGRVALRGDLRLHDMTMRLGLPIAVESAAVHVEESVNESGRLRGWAHIDDLVADIAERRLTDGSLIASYVDGRLTMDNLAGAFEGGILESLGGAGGGARKALGIDLSEPYRFDVAVRLRKVDVAGLLQGVFASDIADEGVLDATLQISGTPAEVLGWTGRGALGLSEGALFSIPVIRALFAQLGFDRTGLFDRMQARFELRDGRVQVDHIAIRSNLFDLIGRGWQDLDGRLAYDLEVRYGLLDSLGIFNRLLYWLNNNLWRVAIRGDFQRPIVTLRNFLFELLTGFDDDPDRLLPLPSFSSLGPRF
jgi:hypothetical protein